MSVNRSISLSGNSMKALMILRKALHTELGSATVHIFSLRLPNAQGLVQPQFISLTIYVG